MIKDPKQSTNGHIYTETRQIFHQVFKYKYFYNNKDNTLARRTQELRDNAEQGQR